VPSQTYATQRILVNEPDRIEFVLTFEPWDVGGVTFVEEKRVRMRNGTNFFQVTSTYRANRPEFIVAVGLSTFGRPALRQNAAAGRLDCWETIKAEHGALGSAIVADPGRIAGFGESGAERFLLVRVKSGEPVDYFVGAAWDGNHRFRSEQHWRDYLDAEGTWPALTAVYRPEPSPAAR
jgi:hypothetical protein